ncbi:MULTISPECIES: TetR/AcrR family transcriptional regulator C-terminal domain-containing protein [Streptomyces]|uniref:TetR/AcrR family transcriptional regulator C-terminal domain-containing protein n=1 Tax=Streptomyces lonegramiae TaxID=3075524 RepID=A0ABU2XI13_9ACTN|nr:TetR/AcrR family transcriptional regulator C-terminal domain-containing protein [Streptomyces sp. DSM 41529]MDT0545042.1 TetR/AcrR family transcriptional regulator C-terminal domain-containing protein [Streptomyces sp. DSM 41529]
MRAAAELAAREPGVVLTIKRVAEAVDSAPMALYRYFPDRDDLLQAVADRIIADAEHTDPPGDTWQDQLRAWMHTSRDRLLPYRQLLSYMAATQQPAWVPALVTLTGVLRPLRLSEEDLALAVTLVCSTVLGHAVYESHRRPAEQKLTALREAAAQRPREEREAVEPLLSHLPEAQRRLYDTVVDRTVATVEALAAR